MAPPGQSGPISDAVASLFAVPALRSVITALDGGRTPLMREAVCYANPFLAAGSAPVEASAKKRSVRLTLGAEPWAAAA